MRVRFGLIPGVLSVPLKLVGVKWAIEEGALRQDARGRAGHVVVVLIDLRRNSSDEVGECNLVRMETRDATGDSDRSDLEYCLSANKDSWWLLSR